jgi:glycerophosphoryl diester phosphodiesterase
MPVMATKYSARVENLLQFLADFLYAGIPRAQPSLKSLQNCKIVSHRGEHDNRSVMENTLAAFDRVVECGAWGIEFDIRWTSDLKPVVIHDADCQRVFGKSLVINRVTLDQLQTEVPEIPSLEQVIQRYASKVHLMVELKVDEFSNHPSQRECLKNLFSALIPAVDFHILALSQRIFKLVDFLPDNALLPVAEFNIGEFSARALQNNYAGISGQYLLVTNKLIQKHNQFNQKTGTGFVCSRYCFYRELNRGVEWIFSNHALKIHAIRNKLLQSK